MQQPFLSHTALQPSTEICSTSGEGESSSAKCATALSSGIPSVTASTRSLYSKHAARGAACSNCRGRKVKCDGLRPICTRCSQAWALRKEILRNKGVSEDELRNLEEPCSYNNITSNRKGDKQREKLNRSKENDKNGPFVSLEEVERERSKLYQEICECCHIRESSSPS